MRLSANGYPVILLSHRRREFLETTMVSLQANLTGASDIWIIDDSGDENHRDWLLDQNHKFLCSDTFGRNIGYLGAMQAVWILARELGGSALLWEEDFVLTKPVDLNLMAGILHTNRALAQLNLQRQPVYRIERRFGYMESHQRRGYHLKHEVTAGVPWVSRQRPFTTNPSLIAAEIFNIDWPSRLECDETPGGAEPAMSQKLEGMGYSFGWLGEKNTPYTHHVGTEMKTGKGY